MENTDPAGAITFGAALRRARQAAGLSLSDLARLGHYSKGYLSRIESGQRHPTVHLAGQYDKLLGAGGALIALVPAARPTRRWAAPGLTGSIRPAQLPPPPTSFTGRECELNRLDAALAQSVHDVPMAVISGMGGVGKTALAVAWAHRASNRFTDGILFADLRGFGPLRPQASVKDVQTGFLVALGVPANLVPRSAAQTTGLYRSVLHDRRILVMLDNAADARQVRPLLPGSMSAAVLITSRSRMAGLCARDGAIPVPLEPLSPDDSRALVDAILGGASQETLRQVTEACGHLPLALRLAAHRLVARVPGAITFGTCSIADRRRLDLLRSPCDPEADLRAVLQWSYDALPAAEQRAVSLLARYTGADLTPPVVAILIGVDLPVAEHILANLGEVHLLHETTTGRFRFHDLFRLFAAERADPDTDALSSATSMSQRLGQQRHS